MIRYLWFGFVVLLGSAGAASAQPFASPFTPNFGTRQTQPISPYMNLLRGGNVATNYFYGVRPALQAQQFANQYGNQGNFGSGLGFPRNTFFPYTDTLSDFQPRDPRAGVAPTGHPTGFFNTMGYFGSGGTAAGRAGGSQANAPPSGKYGLLRR